MSIASKRPRANRSDWQAYGRIHLGWALAERGAAEALAELEAGLEEAILIGARRLEAFHLGLTADGPPTRL